MTDRLSLYNAALLELGERALATLSENREPRRLLDTVWQGGAVEECLATGQWKFAIRTAKLAPSPSFETDFGYRHAYVIPTDHVRTTGVFSDEFQKTPWLDYRVEAGFWFTDLEPLFVAYVSKDAAYGEALARWPTPFVRYVEAYLAGRIVNKLTQDKGEWERVYRLVRMRLQEAASQDAMEGPTVFPPMGRWVASRLGRSSGRYDRGTRGQLTG